MNAVILPAEDYSAMISKLATIIEKITKNPIATNSIAVDWLDIQEACVALKVSKRTLQACRDTGCIGFSKFGGKVYFKASDIKKHLDAHYVASKDDGKRR